MAKRNKKDDFQPLIGEVVVTPPCRAQFVHLTKPDTGNNQYSDDKYKLHMLFPKDKSSGLKAVMQACLKLAQDTWGDEIESLDDLDRIPFRDGDEDSAENWQGFADNIYICSRSKDPVQIVGPDRQLIPADQVYAGAWVRCGLAPYTYEGNIDGNRNGRGVTLLLQFVQFLKDDSRFKGGSAPDIADVFGEFDGDIDALLDGGSEDEQEEKAPKKESKAKKAPAKKPAGSKESSADGLLGMLK